MIRSSAIPILLLAASACGTSAPDDGEICEAGHCDGLPFTEQLKGRNDPIAQFLRGLSDKKLIGDDAVLDSDDLKKIDSSADPLFYAKLTAGIAAVQGCKPESLITYVLSDDLIAGTPDGVYPRIVSTLCSDSELVTNAFVASLGSPKTDGDLDLDSLEMFAWDATQQRFFFYATNLHDDGSIDFEVEPVRCGKCHTTPTDTDPVGMPRIPIMNELTKPWTHWNAGAGGVSESFVIPDVVKPGKNWAKYGETAQAASRFEKVVRDANAQRVTPARGKQLFRPAKLDEAMGLVRPLFCDEQVNYVTELATGEILTDTFVSGGIKNAFRGIQATWPFAWFNNDIVQLGAVAEDQRLFVMPVRGVADVTFESHLQGVLSPAHILALRALDWKKPVFSDFRCNLWKNAQVAFQSGAPKLTGRNRDAVKVLFEEIMKLGGMSTRDLANGKFVAMPVADDATVTALKAAIAAGTVPTSCDGGFCLLDANNFGKELETYVTSLPSKRDELKAERDRRVCKVHSQVEPVGNHTTEGKGRARIANEPSFMRVPTGATVGISTLPTTCN
jgi:hypothetical protein